MRGVVRVLTIAGSDSGGGAGLQADLKTFAARGVYGTSVVTAVTAQNTVAVRAIRGVPPRLVRAQIDAVLDDLGADAIKIGMLLGAPTVAVVAEALAGRRVGPIVVDPVVRASAGTRLLRGDGLRLLRTRLLPLAAVVTPNLAEASALIGEPVLNVDAMREAARRIRALGAGAVVVTGGHLTGDAVDVLAVGRTVEILRGRRVSGAPVHGTGCTFAAALAAELAKGASIVAAVRSAKRYTVACIRRARALGAGQRVLGHLPYRCR